MHKTVKLSAVCTAVLGAVATSAHAQIPLTLEQANRYLENEAANSVTVGVETLHESNGSTGGYKQWNGLDQRSTSAVVDANLSGGDERNGWSLQTERLGAPNPKASAEYERYGVLNLDVDYQRLTHRTDASAEQTRDVYRLGGEWLPADGWVVQSGYQLDHHTGENYAGQQAAPLIYTMDDNHHQFEASVQRIGDDYTARVKYYYSRFENDAIDAEAASKGGATSNLSLNPSNSLNQLSFDGTYNVGEATVLSMQAGYGWLQPESDYYGGASTFYDETKYIDNVKLPTIDLAFTSKPMSALTLNGSYSFRKYDQSLDTYPLYFDDDTCKQGCYYYRSPNYTQHRAKLSGLWNFGGGYSGKLYANYTRKQYDQTVESTDAWVGGLELRKRMSDMLSGTIGYEFTNRTADNWLMWGSKRGTVNDSVKPSVTGSGAYNWTPWYYAAYIEHAVKGAATTNVTDALSFTVTGRVYNRDYRRDGLQDEWLSGVQSGNGQSFGLDVDWAATREVSLFAFYSYDRLKNHLGQRYSVGKAWGHTSMTDETHTVGAGFGWNPEDLPFELGLQYALSFDTTKNFSPWKVESEAASFINNASNRTHYVTANGLWHVTKQWDLGASVSYERSTGDDGSTSGDARINDAEFGHYNDTLFYVGATYKFR